MVRFRKKGFPEYRRYFREEQEAKEDQAAYNEKLLKEGTGAQHIGPRERIEIETAYRLIRDSGLSLVQVVELGLERHGVADGQTIERAFDEFLDLWSRSRAERTVAALKNHLKAFIASVGKGRRIGSIQREDIQPWAYGAKHPLSQRNRLVAVHTFFQYLVHSGKLDRNPAANIPRPSMPSAKVIELFTPEEAEEFLRAVEIFEGGKYAAYYAVLLFAFLRPGEADELKASDFRGSTIRVVHGKRRGRARRLAPICGELRAWLDKYPWNVPTAHWAKQCRKLSPKPWEDDICRHSGISYRMAMIHDERQVSREAGNSPDVIYSNYFELVEKEEAERFFSIRPRG